MAFSDRFAALYLKPTARHLTTDLLARLASQIGLSMTFPDTQSVSLLTEYGEQRSVPLTEFEAVLQQDSEVRLQLWWNDSEDLYCRVERDEIGVSMEFALDGTSGDQEEKVTQVLKQTLVLLAREGTAWGLVLDRSGVTAERPWKNIVTGRSPLRSPYPDEILLPTNSPCLRFADEQSSWVYQSDPAVIEIRPLA